MRAIQSTARTIPDNRSDRLARVSADNRPDYSEGTVNKPESHRPVLEYPSEIVKLCASSYLGECRCEIVFCAVVVSLRSAKRA